MATATTAHTEVPGKTPFPPLQKENFASQLFWLAICFLALYLIASKLALPRVASIISARSDRIADDLAEANRLKGQSDAALAAYEKSLAEARNRAQALANETRERLNAEAGQARRRLEGELNAQLVKAEEAIAATKAAAMANVEGIAIETAAAIVERLIGTAPAGDTVKGAVASALKG
jgi:F-type H+-transporting ATPase subunit b